MSLWSARRWWPLLIFVGIVGAAVVASGLQQIHSGGFRYLHVPPSGPPTCSGVYTVGTFYGAGGGWVAMTTIHTDLGGPVRILQDWGTMNTGDESSVATATVMDPRVPVVVTTTFHNVLGVTNPSGTDIVTMTDSAGRTAVCTLYQGP